MIESLKKAKAFTLIEILIVVVIIGVMAGLVMPRMIRKEPGTEWPQVIQELNNMLYFVRQEAISNQKNYRLTFNALGQERDTIQAEAEENNPEKPGTKHFVPATSEYFAGLYTLPEGLKLHAVFEGKVNKLEENKNKAYCYIVPNGLAQDISVQIRRVIDNVESQATFKVLPFLGKFEYQEGYVKPEK